MARRRKTSGPKMAADDPRRKNLMPPIKPGERRNPTGKNGAEWLKAFRDFFSEIPTEKLPKGAVRRNPDDNRHTIAIRALFRNMVMGSEASLKLGIEQLQGRARQHVELTGAGGGPIVYGDRMTREEMQREIERIEAELSGPGGDADE